MKIVFYMATILEHGGGLEKYFIETVKKLSEFPNIGVDVVTMDDNFSYKVVNLLSFYYFKKINRKSLYKESIDTIKQKLGEATYHKCKSLKELKEKLNEYDIIYSKNELLEALIFKFIIKYKNVPPIIFGCHTPVYYPVADSIQSKLHNFLYNGFVYKYLAKGVRKFHVLNSEDASCLGKLFPKRSIIKIYNPFDYNEFIQKAEKYKYNFSLDKSKLNIIWAGKLIEQKGIDDLIKIINMINKSEYKNKIIWNICGDGTEKEKILNLKKWQNVNYFGHVENNYMASIYKENDLFISTSHWEGFPYNLLEAQSAGLPVLAYNISGCNDIIDNKVNGILVEDINQFKNEIINIIEGKYKFCDINKYIVKKFDQNLIYKQLIDLYKSVVEEK